MRFFAALRMTGKAFRMTGNEGLGMTGSKGLGMTGESEIASGLRPSQ